jgi:hypothetical protein
MHILLPSSTCIPRKHVLQANTQKQVEMHKIKDKARCTMCILEMREQRKMEKPTFTKQLGRDTTIGGA